MKNKTKTILATLFFSPFLFKTSSLLSMGKKTTEIKIALPKSSTLVKEKKDCDLDDRLWTFHESKSAPQKTLAVSCQKHFLTIEEKQDGLSIYPIEQLLEYYKPNFSGQPSAKIKFQKNGKNLEVKGFVFPSAKDSAMPFLVNLVQKNTKSKNYYAVVTSKTFIELLKKKKPNFGSKQKFQTQLFFSQKNGRGKAPFYAAYHSSHEKTSRIALRYLDIFEELNLEKMES